VCGIGVYHEGHITVAILTAATAVGMFHLFTHAFFKSLLFMGAGSVNHVSGTFDMRKMGGLRKYMPWTFATFLIGSLALVGIWPLSGFWSKDEILLKTLENQPVLFVLAIITVFMTAFYTFRAVFMTFGGEYKGGEPAVPGVHEVSDREEHNDDTHHPHESPASMVVPMFLLSLLAIVAGLWNVNGGFNALFGAESEATGSFLGNLVGIFTHSALPILSLVVALAGIFLAYAMYSKKWISAEKVGSMFKSIYNVLINKYFMDVLYEDIIVKKLLLGKVFVWFQKFDTGVIDGAVNGAASAASGTGKVLRKWETGKLQLYGIFMAIGVLAIIICLFIFG
jgi:NADH-quinone oxidoreductase subunit L